MPLGATIEKIARHGQDHVLEREGDARRREPEHRHEGGELAREMEDQDERDGRHDDDVAGAEQEPPVIVVRHVPDDGDSPEHGAREDGAQGDRDPDDLDGEPTQHLADLAIESAPPGLHVGDVSPQEGRLLAQGQHHGAEKLGAGEQCSELVLSVRRGLPVHRRAVRELAKTRHHRANSLPGGPNLAADLSDELVRRSDELLERAPVALQGEQPIDEGPGALRRSRTRGGRPGGGSAGRRARRREGVLEGLDLIGQIAFLIGRGRVGPIQLGQEFELDAAELEPVPRGSQLPIDRGPGGGRRRAEARPELRDVALAPLDGGFEL
jgi:hypothetical protein